METQLSPRQIAGAATKHALTSKNTQCSVTILNESPDAFDNLCQALAN
jgi:hypothetical protein